MTTDKFRKGDRVRYIGGLVPSLKGRIGTVKSYGRNGWCLVDYDNGEREVKTADVNLEKVN